MDTEADGAVVHVEGVIEASHSGLDTFHRLLADYWRAVAAASHCQPDASWRALFDSAVAEIAGNIARHAYPAPQAGSTFHITLLCLGDRMEAIMLDRGIPCELTPPDDPPDMRVALEDLDRDHGWGLPIAHAAADTLTYERLDGKYNRWRVGKRLPC